jgi:FG-GAP-like repeat/FG-GAP repeat
MRNLLPALPLLLTLSAEAFPLRELPRAYPMGRAALQVIDLDGDGHLDLLSGSQTALKIAYGRGGGTLETPVTLALGKTSAVYAADFDGDGRGDLVHIHESTPLLLRRNLGDRRFGEPVAIHENREQFTGLTVADFTGDGAPDVLMLEGNRRPPLLKNDGRGTSFLFELDPGIEAVSALTPGDLEGDGDLDLAASGRGGITTFLNDGTGRFMRVPIVFGDPLPFTIGNFDGDRNADLVVFRGREILIYFDGTGNPSRLQLERDIGGVFAGDLNGDGVTDLVVTGPSSPFWIELLRSAVFLGTGRGELVRAPDLYGVNGNIAIADMNEDALPDLIGSADPNEAGVILGNGDGTFDIPYEVPSGLPQARLIDRLDADGDGIDELLMRDQSNLLHVGTLRGDGAYSYEQLEWNGQSALSQVETADLDGDGRDEIVAGHSGVSVYTLTAAGWRRTEIATRSWPEALVTADVNGDGVREIAVVEEAATGAFVNVHSLTGAPIASRIVRIGYHSGMLSEVRLRAADLDRDGDDDLIVVVHSTRPITADDPRGAVADGAVIVLRAAGDGGFHASAVLRDALIGSSFIGDVNGDGAPDVIVDYVSGPAPRDIFINTGNATFRRADPPPDSVPYTQRFDFNLDGLVDERSFHTIRYASASGPPRVVSYLSELFPAILVRRSRHEPPVLMKTTADTGNFLIVTLERDPVRRRAS